MPGRTKTRQLKRERSPALASAICSALSRQRIRQIDQKAKGNCTICWKPGAQGRELCDECAKRKSHVKYRKPLKSEWRDVDWSEPNAVIAARFGVTTAAVHYQRRKHTPNSDYTTSVAYPRS